MIERIAYRFEHFHLAAEFGCDSPVHRRVFESLRFCQAASYRSPRFICAATPHGFHFFAGCERCEGIDQFTFDKFDHIFFVHRQNRGLRIRDVLVSFSFLLAFSRKRSISCCVIGASLSLFSS